MMTRMLLVSTETIVQQIVLDLTAISQGHKTWFSKG